MIRQIDALAKIMQRATAPTDRALLLDQAVMIARLSAATVAEEADRAAVSAAYQAVLDAQAEQGEPAA